MSIYSQKLIALGKRLLAGIRALPTFRLSTLRKVFSLMGKREKIAFIALSAIALISLFISLNHVYVTYTRAVPAQGGQFNEGIIGQPRFINPLLATTDADNALVRLVFSGLYKYDGAGTLMPDLAENLPEVSANQKEYTVHLRRNAKWHNDKPVTADDVVFTIHVLQDPRYNSPLRSDWLNTTVTKKDDYTVVFTVKDVSGPFIHNLTLPLLSHAMWENVKPENFTISEQNIKAVGSGAYVIREIKKLPQGTVESIKLQSFGNFYTGRANIDSIQLIFYDNYDEVLNALHGRIINGFGFVPFDQNFFLDKSNKSLIVSPVPLPQYQALFFNLTNKIFSEKSVRQALLLATDKNEIIQNVYNGNARLISGPILEEQVNGVTNKGNSFNLDEAKKLLDNAGWVVNNETGVRTKNKVPLEFTIATNDFSLNVQTAELLQKQWEKLNIKVHLNTLPTKELTDNVIRPRKFEALVFAQNIGADPDPFVFWHSSQAKNPGLNLTGFNNAAADKLISEARTTTDAANRAAKYKQFQDLVNDETPAIFLNQNVFVYAIDKRIKGVGLRSLFEPAGRFADLPNWFIDERRVLK